MRTVELDEEQIEALHLDLLALRTQLEDVLTTFTEGAKPVDLDAPIGRLTRMDAIQQQQMSAANKRSAQSRLALVMTALSGVADGRYGECRHCEEPIGWGRLKARPESAFCLICQTKAERRS